jgi:hypothetical protein
MSYQRFILTSGATSETLTINPDGWDKWGQMWQRDKKYWGVFQSYTPQSYRFAIKKGGGGDFIKRVYETNGIFAQMTVSVYTRNPQTNDFDFSYTGNLNFDPTKFKIERDYVEIGFVANSDMQNFITRDDIEMDITNLVSIDGVTMDEFENSPKDVLFKKVDIYSTVNCKVNLDTSDILQCSLGLIGEGYDIEDKKILFDAYEITKNELSNKFSLTTGKLNSERSESIYTNPLDVETYIIFKNSLFDIIENTLVLIPSFSPAGNFGDVYIRLILSALNENGEVEKIFYNYGIPIPFDDISHQSTHIISDISNLNPDDDFHPGGYPSNDPLCVPIGITINPSRFKDNLGWYKELFYPPIKTQELGIYEVPPKGSLSLYLSLSTPYDGIDGAGFWDGSNAWIEGNFKMDLTFTELVFSPFDSNVKCFFPHEAFTRMLQKILSKNSPFYSTFFGRTDSEFITYPVNGEGSLDAITSGWNLRGFPSSQFLLKFKDLFKSFDAIYNLMVGYDLANQRFYIEQKEKAFDSSFYMFDLGDVDELKISPYKDCFFNEVLSGYEEDGNYEDFQGANEFNVMTGHSTIIPLKDKLDIRSKYNADTTGMELARRKDYTHFSSEDTDQDSKIYIVRTNGTETIQGGATGFLGSEQYYNIVLTPRENIIRWANYIKGAFFRPENSDFTIKFQSSKKNIDINYVNQNGDTVYEHQDITNFGDMADVIRLFNAEYYEFKGIFREQFAAILRLNPHGLITFTFDGVAYEGFIDELQTEDYNQKASYKLIAHESSTDVQKVFMDGSNALFMDNSYHKFI